MILRISILFLISAWAIFDASMQPREAWQRSGHEKSVWILLCLFTNFIGAALYLAWVRPRVRACAAQLGL